MDAFLDTAMTQVSLLAGQWGLKVVAAIAVLLIGRIVSGWARKIAKKTMTRANVDDTLIPFASGVIYFALLAIVVVMSLGALGINTTSLVAVFGAAGLAIALAFQGTFSNFASGVMLLVFRPISVGQFVDVGGTAGNVVEVGVFSTTLNTPDNVLVVRPWCNAEDYWDMRFDLTKALKEALDHAGLSIPYPQRDVHLHNVA